MLRMKLPAISLLLAAGRDEAAEKGSCKLAPKSGCNMGWDYRFVCGPGRVIRSRNSAAVNDKVCPTG